MESQLTVDKVGLARILHRSPGTVARQMSSRPQDLPPAVRGTKPRIWRLDAIDQWLREREREQGIASAAAAAAEPRNEGHEGKRRPGRPRKAPQAQAQAQAVGGAA